MFIAITHQRDHVFNPWTMDHDTVKMDPTITMAMARGCSWDLGHTARSAAHRGDGRCPPLPILVSEPDGDEARIHMPWIEHQHLKRLKMPVFFSRYKYGACCERTCLTMSSRICRCMGDEKNIDII